MPYDISAVPLLAPALDEIVGRRVRDGHAPSSAYALVAGGAVVATGGAGGEMSPAPDGGTAFRIASCTKSFTATAMLQLRDSGLLDIHTPVDAILPLAVTGGSAPTVAQLAGMVGGIPFDDPWADRQESMTTADFDTMTARGIRLVSEPGTRYEYSSLGYALLGRVLERVSGRRYIDLVRDDVLRPLGLDGIAFDRSVQAPGGIAGGFARVGDDWVEQPWAEPGAFSPLGGLLATPAALGAWVAWLAAAWQVEGAPEGTAGARAEGARAEGTAGDRVLAAASRRELQLGRMPTGTAPGTRYGWGLVAEDHPRHGAIVSHSGGYPGFGAHMRWHTGSGIGVVVLENARYSGAIRAATAGLTTVLDSTRAAESPPALWPETLAARAVVEELLRGRPDAVARIASDNLELDEPLTRRAAHAATIAARIGLAPDAPVIGADAVDSESAAHLAWSVRGTRGSARCEVRLTPEASPRLQTLVIRLG